MDPVRNPFAPGAGSQPPELAGRDVIVSDAEITIQRILRGRYSQSQILLGLRGVGKTVLLNKIEIIAESHSHTTSFIEAPENRSFPELIYPKAHQAIRQLSMVENARSKAYSALGALRAFASAFKIKVGDVSIAVEPRTGIADSGNLEFDLVDLFLSIGETAQAAGRAWTLLVDEMQYLSGQDLAALIVAIHRVNQRNLPVLFFGAGLPQVAALSGDAKSYAERLFKYPAIGPLPPDAASNAIRQPIEDEGESISQRALVEIVQRTQGYPYFLQEWGFQAWNLASSSPISEPDIAKASEEALRRLDNGFFKVRFDRLTPKERDYVIAIAGLGKGPYRSADVAQALGENVQSLGPRRAQIIRKGMIYSPAHGDIAFTVPLFEEYLKRHLKLPGKA